MGRYRKRKAKKVGVNALNHHLWQTARRRAIKRADWRCERCTAPGRLEVHHIEPLHKGGEPFDMTNLQVLCRNCHIEVEHGEQSAAYREWDGRMKEHANATR